MFLFILSLFFSFSVWGQTQQTSPSPQGPKNEIIINNEVQTESSGSATAISAPALVPSQATKLRTLREKQEVQTEDSLLKELEKQRLLDEQKRLEAIMGPSQPESTVSPTAPDKSTKPKLFPGLYGKRQAYFAPGVGFVYYHNVENVDSLTAPAFFLSVGAFQTPIMIDFSVFFAQQEIKLPNTKEEVYELGASLATKYVLINGPVRPYIGAQGALIARNSKYDAQEKFRGLKGSVNLGGAVGLDILLGSRLGLNMDFRYYKNFRTENQVSLADKQASRVIIDHRDSIVLSLKFKYFF